MTMRRLIALAVALSVSSLYAPLITAAGAAQGGASIAGTATSSTGQTVANVTVQLRNLATGQLAGTTTSSATGGFSFAGLPAGNFSVEVVNAAGQIIGSSASIAVTAGATITGVTVTASAALGAAAGAGAAAAGAAAAGGGAAAGISTAVIITSVAAAAGVVGAVAIAANASPSR
jgi:hypothetical protein